MMYLLVRGIGRLYLRLLRGLEVRNAHLVPREGPLIICPNHIDWVDPVVVACGTARLITFMAKSELFRNRLAGWFLRQLHAFPVRRGESDRPALRISLETLRRGGVLGIFPEGTRSKTGRLQSPEPGAAVIALRTGATVIPAGVQGTQGSRPVTLVWGEPFRPGEVVAGAENHDSKVRILSDEIMRRIALLTGQEPLAGRQQSQRNAGKTQSG